MVNWYVKPMAFEGEIELGGQSAPVTFSAGVTIAGVAQIDLAPFAMDAERVFIVEAFYDQKFRPAEFSLVGKASGGATFESARAIVLSLGAESLDGAAPTKPLVSCQECAFVFEGERRSAPAVKALLRGFSAFHALSAQCPLGEVEMMGAASLSESQREELTGRLQVNAPASGVDVERWREDATGFLRHVRGVMSFARGAGLAAPVVEWILDGRVEVVVGARSSDRATGMATFSPGAYGPIFDRAVQSHFAERPRAQGLDVAIEWFTMPNGYREGMLTSAMTVLEHLLTKNLSEAETRARDRKRASVLRKAMLGAARSIIEQWEPDQAAVDAELEALTAKLEDVNRRTLREKIAALASRWGVPMDGISDEALAAAKRARDHIVHRGLYERRASDADLMDHVRLARELVVRFLLAGLEFEGFYISHLAGDHSKPFKLLRASEKQ